MCIRGRRQEGDCPYAAGVMERDIMVGQIVCGREGVKAPTVRYKASISGLREK